MNNPALNRFNEKKRLIDDINNVLKKNGVVAVLKPEDITVTDKTVSDAVRPESRLSIAIIDYLWPSISTGHFYHYTSRDAAESILNSGVFRMTNIEKRFKDDEIFKFCETHGLTGYLAKDDNETPLYRTLLMPQLFYASFTETNLSQEEEERFWNSHAQCDGVRLTFDVEVETRDLRKIIYEETPKVPIKLLNELTTMIHKKYERELVLGGISRICAFYLSGESYGWEKESRALFKAWLGIKPNPVGVGEASYVEFPLGQMIGGYKFSVTEVHASTLPKMPRCYTFTQRASSP